MMNDKEIFYQECSQFGLPIPQYWVIHKLEAVQLIMKLINFNYKSLYIRHIKSSGSFANVTVEYTNKKYNIPELGFYELLRDEFVQILESFLSASHTDQFIISE